MNVIIRSPNWIGDVIMSLPFLESLVNSDNIDKVFVYTRKKVAEIYENVKFKDNIQIILENKKFSFFKNAILIPKNIDYAFILTPTFPATLPFVLRGIKNIFGFYSKENKFFISKGINTDDKEFKNHHLTQSFLSLLRFINVREKYSPPFFNYDESILDKFKLGKYEYFVIVPGASYGPAKRWDFSNFVKVANVINKNIGLLPVMVGTKKEIDEIKTGQNLTNIYDLSGKTTLTDIINILKYAKFTLTNDSGLMHISYMSNTKTFAIFGSTSPKWTGPLFKSTIFYSQRACSPCFKRTCKLGHYGCLKDIDVNEVIEKILEEYNETSGFLR